MTTVKDATIFITGAHGGLGTRLGERTKDTPKPMLLPQRRD